MVDGPLMSLPWYLSDSLVVRALSSPAGLRQASGIGSLRCHCLHYHCQTLLFAQTCPPQGCVKLLDAARGLRTVRTLQLQHTKAGAACHAHLLWLSWVLRMLA